MSNAFFAHAIPRQDNQNMDGIHLLWTAPAGAGYSIDGYDIQRLAAGFEQKITCCELTQQQFEQLHAIHHTAALCAQIYYRQAECPQILQPPHDEPVPADNMPRTFKTHIDFQQMEPGWGDNPRTEQDIIFQVKYKHRLHETAVRPDGTQIIENKGIQGLNVGHRLWISLPNPAYLVQLTLTNFASEVIVVVYHKDEVLDRHTLKYDGDPDTLKFDYNDMTAIEILAPQNRVLVQSLEVHYLIRPVQPAVTPATVMTVATHVVGPALAAATTARIGCHCYDIILPDTHYYTSVAISVPGFAIAMLDGKAVATQLINSAQPVEFRNEPLDEIVIYTSSIIWQMQICVDDRSVEYLESIWSRASLIAKKVQIPIRNLDVSLGSIADENSLAAARLIGSETFSAADFQEVAGVMNGLARNPGVSPMLLSMMTREKQDDPFIELRAWPYSLALTTDAKWRRMLGFGYLDPDSELQAGRTYHYRITGRFWRRDLHEKIYGFHTIPAGTMLPAQFDLDDVTFALAAPVQVEFFPPVGANALHEFGRKGIRIMPDAGGGFSMTLQFSQPVQEIVLELGDTGFHGLSYEVTATTIVPGFTGTFQDIIPLQERVELVFPEPVDQVRIKGSGFLYALRVKAVAGSKSDEIIEHHVDVMNVVYQDSPLPEPPVVLGTVNLQEPILPGDPAVRIQNPPNELGFRLRWLPPPRAGTPLVFLPDCSSMMPSDVMGYAIERRRVDTGGNFRPIDTDDTLYSGSRGRRKTVETIAPGANLLALFPEIDKPVAPIDPYMSMDDVLTNSGGAIEPPGSLHQYQMFSVDAIGRRSSLPRTGSIVRLEKLVPPPQPVAPVDPPPPVPLPAGVRARLLQATDPDIVGSPDASFLAGHQNAIVLEWGWRAEERKADPYAKEFRVYWHSLPPDQIAGTLIGSATTTGGLLEMRANLNQAVTANRLKDQRILAGGYTFRIESNSAGMNNIVIRFLPNARNAAALPEPVNFSLTPILDGSERRPAIWTERLAVIPVTGGENYQFVIHDLVTINVTNPYVRFWVGVSAADDQSYVADEIPAAQPNGGRPGNESSLAVVTMIGRYIGQPIFTVPDPLPDVPEILTDEPVIDSIDLELDLPALLPGLSVSMSQRLRVERMPSSSLMQCISVQNNAIRALLPDKTTAAYSLSNPQDQQDFLDQIRSGEPGRIEGRFLMAFLLNFKLKLRPLWQSSSFQDPVSFAPVTDILPRDPERYFYRLRLVDTAGHESSDEAFLPVIGRVVSLRMPAVPEIKLSGQGDGLDITAVVHDAYDLKWLVLFQVIADTGSPLNPSVTQKAQLLRLPNRRDLYPGDGLRLRLADGTLLAPAASIDMAAGTPVGLERHLEISLTPGFEKRVSVWAVSLTRDGINSRFNGPFTVQTGLTPLVAPSLTASSSAVEDTIVWGTIADPSNEISLERSTDSGITWNRVSPWLPGALTEYTVLASAGSRLYRLALRAQGNRTAESAEVSLS